jgi:hypothetical protein
MEGYPRMATAETKTTGRSRFNVKQLLGFGIVLAVIIVAVATDSLVIGYVGMTLVLCAFLLVVGYDVGVTKRAPRA